MDWLIAIVVGGADVPAEAGAARSEAEPGPGHEEEPEEPQEPEAPAMHRSARYHDRSASMTPLTSPIS